MARRNVAWYSVHTSLQNIRRSSWTLNCLALHKISRCCGELSSLFMAWRARNHQKYKPQIEQRSAGRHDVIESEHYRETITWCCGCSFYHSLHALVSLNMFIVLSRVMTWIKCRLSSSIFFFGLTLIFQWEFNFKDSLNIAGVGEKLDFVCTLDAMVRKLISLICFDIFQSKWYR